MTLAANPYKLQPNDAFWSRAVARDWNPRALFRADAPLLVPEDRIVSAGSCFAANIVPPLEAAGFEYVRTETVEATDDRFNYGRYSAAYGNIYSARQFRQLVERCVGRFKPCEDRWASDDGVIDPFRPGLPFPAEDDDEFDLVTTAHLGRVKAAFEQASVVVFTLGLSEAWESILDGAVFPSCPGVIAGSFDEKRHRFVNFRASEVVDDLRAAFVQLRELNRSLRFVLTVSPVPLVATATNNHVYVANFYSKATLRAAAEEVAATMEDVTYFPALEIVLGMDGAANFEPDLRNVSTAAVAKVLDVLFSHCRRPESGRARVNLVGSALQMSQQLVRRECEEAMNDPDLTGSASFAPE